MNETIIKVFVLPGGILPKAAEGNPRGHDVFLSRIVGEHMDKDIPYQRETLWDFKKPVDEVADPEVAGRLLFDDIHGKQQWVYVLPPKGIVRIGMGVVFGMTPGWWAWIAKKSSDAKKRLAATMHPLGLLGPDLAEVLMLDHYVEVPIDPDFRGEPVTLLENLGVEEIVMSYGQKMTQLCFLGPDNNWYPKFEIVSSVAELGNTGRANGSHGSTGSHHEDHNGSNHDRAERT